MDPEQFNHEVADAAREMVETPGTDDTLARAVQMATDLIGACDLAGVSVVTVSGVETRAASGEDLRRIDELQYEIGEGPCLDALRQDETVTSNDLATDPRWPTWGPKIAENVGVHASLSYRLFTTGDDLGALNLYSRSTNAFTTDDLTDGLTLAAHAAVALSATLREEHLARALHSRTVIGQATGILMERFDISSDRAFEVLKRVSSRTNTRLHQVSVNLVESRRLPDA